MSLEERFEEVFEDFKTDHNEDKLFYIKEPIDDVQLVKIVNLLEDEQVPYIIETSDNYIVFRIYN